MYTSTEQITARIGRELDVNQTAYANDYVIPAIQSYINTYLGIRAGAGGGGDPDGVFYVSGNGTSVIWVGFVKVTDVEYVGADLTSAGTIDDNDVFQDGGYLWMRGNARWARGQKNIKVTCESIVSPAIQQAATIMASKMVLDQGLRAVDSEKIGDYQVTYSNLSTQQAVSNLVDDNVIALLAPYKPLRVA